MKVTVIRPHLGQDGRVIEPPTIMEVSDLRARELEMKNLAVPVMGRNLPKGAASEGTERPIQTLPRGGQTGAEKPVSSSPPVPPPQTPESRTPEEKPALSPSTPPGSSPRGRTRSTPATMRGGKTTRALRSSKV